MSNMITNPEFTVFTCLLIDKVNHSAEKSQIMIILNLIEVKIFKLIKSNPCIKDNTSEKVNLFALIKVWKILIKLIINNVKFFINRKVNQAIK